MSTPNSQKPRKRPAIKNDLETPEHYAHQDHSFNLQLLMEMQRSIIELTSTVNSMKATVDSTKSKVDDLIKWKSMIVGGALTIGFLIGLGFTVIKALDNVTVNFVKQEQAQQTTK